MKGTLKRLEIKKSFRVGKKNSDIIKKVAKMSLSGGANTQHKEDPARTTTTTSDKTDWFSMSVSTFQNFKDLAQQNSTNSMEELPIDRTVNEVQFTEISRGKRLKSKTNDHLQLTLTKKYKMGLPSQLELKNKFEPLAALNSSNQNETSPNQTQPIKIPPIYLQADNSQEVINDLKKITKCEFKIKQCYRKIKVQLGSTDDFRTVTKFYDEGRINYFTFINPEERPLSVVMRGVPYSISEEEAKNELIKLNYPVIRVTRLLKTSKPTDGVATKTLTPLLAVDLKNNDQGKTIFNLDRFIYSVISVEPRRRSSNIPQCTNCQKYNHTKNFCKLEPRCVKCAGPHHYTNCPSRKVEIPLCVNCGKNHTANYKGCEYYLKLKSKFSNQQRIIRPQDQNNPRPNTSPTATNQSENVPPPLSSSNTNTYASKLRSKPTPTHNNHDNLSQQSNLLDLIGNLITNIIKPLIPKIQSFLTQIITSLFSSFQTP
jgi:hypothetical protein